ncbi:MAG: hypothetical protein ABEN55_07610 [Bradymonadaceae bacterium]
MAESPSSCLMSQTELLDEYFKQYRNHLLALAAFLDRLDRCAGADAETDFRMRALRKAVEVLPQSDGTRAERVQMILSDLDVELLDECDTQSAHGAARDVSPATRGGE